MIRIKEKLEQEVKEYMDNYETPNASLPREYLESRGWKLVNSCPSWMSVIDYSPKCANDYEYLFNKGNKLLKLKEEKIIIDKIYSDKNLYFGKCNSKKIFEEILGGLKCSE